MAGKGTGVTVRPATHAALSSAAVNLGPAVGRKISLDALISAALAVSADGHRDELVATLRRTLGVDVEGGAA
jgi:hypothetical protein